MRLYYHNSLSHLKCRGFYMTNLEVQNNIFTFSINGGDLKTTKIALYGPIICILLPSFVYWIGIAPYLVPEIIPSHTNTWIVFMLMLMGLLE